MMNKSYSCYGKILFAAYLSLSAVTSYAANPDDILGYWRTIDDETGFAKAIVHIQKAKDGTYLGTVVESIARPDYKPAEFCRDCPAPFTNRRIIDMPLVWNIRPDPRKEFHYIDGYAIDPLSGKIYAGDFRLSTNGRRLSLRGKVIGAGFLNRTQTWLRETNYTPKP